MKRQYWGVVTTLGVVSLAGVFLSTNVALSGGSSEAVDFREIAAQLTPRGYASAEGVVSYRYYRFRVSSDLFDDLADLLTVSQDLPQDDLIAQVESWLDANLPPEREAWDGECAFRPSEWRDTKMRLAGIDSSTSAAQALATTAGVNAAPLTNQVVRHSDGVVETTIEDGLTVFKKPAHPIHPLVPLDISLASWQDAIDFGATVDGQDIHGESDGNVHSITYVNSLADGSFVATAYTFDAGLGWAPRDVHSFDGDGTLMRIVFGYMPVAAGDLMRPRAVAKGEVRDASAVETSLWLIESWEESSDPSLVELREPALYLELDFTGGTGAPVVTVREPDILIGIEPCAKVQVAIVSVLEALGTDDRAADYNYDGIVDAGDIEAVLEKFGASGQ